MNRRAFLEWTTLGTAYTLGADRVLTAAPLRVGADSSERARPAPAFHLRRFEWEEATIADLQAAMAKGRETAVSLTRAYLRRIEDLNRRGPKLQAVLEVNPDALATARDLDKERKAQGPRGPLHGIPVLLKDNIGTHDRMTTTAGSLALKGSIPPRDSFVAQRLREAGAVILGKTNLSEWANFRGHRSSSGWSARGGQTRNPYALDRNPSGSSSGSAVAVAASMCPVAVGTETDGSIVSPSALCGIVGIKPTVGLVSRSGIIPIAHSQDTAGPMARTVRDAAMLLGAMTGVDPADAGTEFSRDKAHTDYTPFLDPNGLYGARLGVARRFFRSGSPAAEVLEGALEEMKRRGATLVDPADDPPLPRFGDAEMTVMLYEFKADLNAYLAALGPGAPVHSLEELIAFNERNKDKEMPFFGQELFLQAQAKGPLTDKAYIDALERCRRLSQKEGLDALLDRQQLDAVVAPSGGPAGKTDPVYGDRDAGGSSSPAAVAGYPNITVPAGFVFGLPVGISFFGRAYSEPTLLKLAYGFEQATHVRRPPTFALSVD
jgi:amidase